MSSNLSKMKFMAKARELQAAKQGLSAAPDVERDALKTSALEETRWVAVSGVSDVGVSRREVQVDPLSRKGSIIVRRSFGGFNATVEQRTGKV